MRFSFYVVRIAFASLLSSAVTLLAQDMEKPQSWTSADGREMTAAVLKIDDGSRTVKMKRDDGFIFTISFDELAKEDAARLEAAVQKKADDNKNPDQVEQALEELPNKFECDNVPMVQQKGAYCVPASAAMIAGYHGIKTDQDQIAFLSSADSFNNQGTDPKDMLLAMEKLGFDGKSYYWYKAEDFEKKVLPLIREALFRKGPIYVSFRSGVFGNSGHGCVIIGYHDRKEVLTFHNPWGNVFEKDFEEVATQAHGIVIIEAPEPAPIASEAFIQNIEKIVPTFDGNVLTVTSALEKAGQKHGLIWCSRKDAREDKKFAADTARDDGRTILNLSFHRNPAVIIPGSKKDGTTEKFLFVTRPPEGGAKFMVREITETGWSDPKLITLGSLTRTWPTKLESENSANIVWELPMIELHPDD